MSQPGHITTSDYAHPHMSPRSDRVRSPDQTTVHENQYEHAGSGRPSYESDNYREYNDPVRRSMSTSRMRAESHRYHDLREIANAERTVSRINEEAADDTEARPRSSSRYPRSRSKHPETHADEFEKLTKPEAVNGAGAFRPPDQPLTAAGKFFKKLHKTNWFFRYLVYIVPVAAVLLVPVIMGGVAGKRNKWTVGGVELLWMGIWWEIIWLTLWASRIAAKMIPYIVAVGVSLFTNQVKTMKDLCIALEPPITLFFWMLSVVVSFRPICKKHHLDGDHSLKHWETNAWKVMLTIFIATVLNLVEKIVIQFIAIRFHQRQYEDRITMNKFAIDQFAKLYKFSRDHSAAFEEQVRQGQRNSFFKFANRSSPGYNSAEPNSGQDTPPGMKTPNLDKALLRTQDAMNVTMQGAKKAVASAGDAIGKVAGEIANRNVEKSSAPRQVVLQLLSTTGGSQTLARQLFKTYLKPGNDSINMDDLRPAYEFTTSDGFNQTTAVNQDELDASYQLFDKDLNGDVSCEELEFACVDVGRERKAIISSLKDLDSAISKLDEILMVIVVIIVVLVFLSLIASGFSGILTSAGTTLLGLSWLFSATAQELLASIVFVFVKHPFDVGDRCDIYFNNATTSLIVKEISLMATEFKGLDNMVWQAPNNVLNQLFILNHRRTGATAEAVFVMLKFGTTLDQIVQLKDLMAEFVRSEKRDFKGEILTELTDIPDLLSVKLKVVFFHKSNWQNEGFRLARRNKFMCALMTNIQVVGIEPALYHQPGKTQNTPMFLAYQQPPPSYTSPHGSPAQQQGVPEQPQRTGAGPSGMPAAGTTASVQHAPSVQHQQRHVDFSLGASSMIASDETNDLHDYRLAVPEIALEQSGTDEQRREADMRRRAMSRSKSRPGRAANRVSTNSQGSSSAVDASGAELQSVQSHRNRFGILPRASRQSLASRRSQNTMQAPMESVRVDPSTQPEPVYEDEDPAPTVGDDLERDLGHPTEPSFAASRQPRDDFDDAQSIQNSIRRVQS